MVLDVREYANMLGAPVVFDLGDLGRLERVLLSILASERVI